VLRTGDQVLLVRHTYGAPEWDLPGGAVRRGERPEATARREMHEELGVTIDDWALLGEVWANSYRCRDTLHCYAAEVDGAQFAFDRAELAAAGWFPLARLPPDVKPHVHSILALL
jgi:8-oxo-dGTP pyrophosphatase MutT (NUDIX family)